MAIRLKLIDSFSLINDDRTLQIYPRCFTSSSIVMLFAYREVPFSITAVGLPPYSSFAFHILAGRPVWPPIRGPYT